MDNLLLEDGSKLLFESGQGIFLESYVPPNNFLTPNYVVSDTVMNSVVRANTPKFIAALSFGVGQTIMTRGIMVSSAPAKNINSIVMAAGDTVMSMATAFSVTTPRHMTPTRHYVWVYGLDGKRVNVIV